MPELCIRELQSVADLRRAIQLEKQVWGLDDADSWVPDAYPGFGNATLLDDDLRPKPAFGAFRTALLRR